MPLPFSMFASVLLDSILMATVGKISARALQIFRIGVYYACDREETKTKEKHTMSQYSNPKKESLFVIGKETKSTITLVPNPRVRNFKEKLARRGLAFDVTRIVLKKKLKGNNREICMYHMTDTKGEVEYDSDMGLYRTWTTIVPLYETEITWSSANYWKQFPSMKHWQKWTDLVVGFAFGAGVRIKRIPRLKIDRWFQDWCDRNNVTMTA